MDTQLNALPTLAVRARTVSGCVNSAFLNKSQHFTAHLFRPWILSSAHGIDGGSRPFTAVVLNESSSIGSLGSHDGTPRCAELAGSCLGLLVLSKALVRSGLKSN